MGAVCQPGEAKRRTTNQDKAATCRRSGAVVQIRVREPKVSPSHASLECLRREAWTGARCSAGRLKMKEVQAGRVGWWRCSVVEALEEGKTGGGSPREGLPGAICRRSTATCNLDVTRKAQMRDVETLSEAPLPGPLGSPLGATNPTKIPLDDHWETPNWQSPWAWRPVRD